MIYLFFWGGGGVGEVSGHPLRLKKRKDKTYELTALSLAIIATCE